MRYFLDTEFIEDGKAIDLISIGLVSEDGRTLYRQNCECDFSRASDWVWRNVFPHLSHFNMRGNRLCNPTTGVCDSGLDRRTVTPCRSKTDDPCPWATRREMGIAILEFCNPDTYGKPEFWGYFSDYDWVAFCQLSGTMMQLPKGYPMYCLDIKQYADFMGNPTIPKPAGAIHNALADALWTKDAYAFLNNIHASKT